MILDRALVGRDKVLAIIVRPLEAQLASFLNGNNDQRHAIAVRNNRQGFRITGRPIVDLDSSASSNGRVAGGDHVTHHGWRLLGSQPSRITWSRGRNTD